MGDVGGLDGGDDGVEPVDVDVVIGTHRDLHPQLRDRAPGHGRVRRRGPAHTAGVVYFGHYSCVETDVFDDPEL